MPLRSIISIFNICHNFLTKYVRPNTFLCLSHLHHMSRIFGSLTCSEKKFASCSEKKFACFVLLLVSIFAHISAKMTTATAFAYHVFSIAWSRAFRICKIWCFFRCKAKSADYFVRTFMHVSAMLIAPRSTCFHHQYEDKESLEVAWFAIRKIFHQWR